MIISSDDPVSKGAQRFEVFTGAGKRRDWPPEVKASIVAECYSGREGVSAVARRHGLDPSQVYAWRRDLRKRLEAEGVVLPLAEPEAVAFVPAVIEPSAVPDLLLQTGRYRGGVLALTVHPKAIKLNPTA